MHDLVNRNGRVVDGSGAGAPHSDLTIAGEWTVDDGQDVGRGRHEFDADAEPAGSTAALAEQSAAR